MAKGPLKGPGFTGYFNGTLRSLEIPDEIAITIQGIRTKHPLGAWSYLLGSQGAQKSEPEARVNNMSGTTT